MKRVFHRPKIALSALSIAAILVGFGCHSPATTSGEPEEANGAGSFAWMGEAHNDGLDYGIARAAVAGKVDRDLVVRLTESFLAQREEEMAKRGYTPFALDYYDLIDQALGGEERFLDILGNRLAEGAVSGEFHRFATEMLALAGEEDLAGLGRLGEEAARSKMSDTERTGILASLAIAEASLTYWTGVRESGGAGKNLIRWRRILTADLVGALGGAMAGAVGGPVGAGAGACGGALAGSMGCWLLG